MWANLVLEIVIAQLGQACRENVPGPHGIDGDAVLGKLNRSTSHEAFHPCLAGTVVCEPLGVSLIENF
jgi:hypothetical protein